MKGAKLMRQLAACWGVIGVTLFLLYPIQRLSSYTLEAFDYSWSAIHWLALLVNIVFMAYSEGYQGFQKNFSPRVAARALYLSREAGLLNGLLAPVFCLGYFGTTRKRQISVLLLTLMIIMLIYMISQLPQPWRGIVDAGVVVGLTWGLGTMLFFVRQAFSSENFAYSPELSPCEAAKTGY